ncbi:YegS/Rv2252/BmrU family lipid kinase [Nocardioides campestrisoli]|uniref:YegS/Rv2252/BmrU family lipid kinase n=1 Tax=Nocardioides campestrisoli TaxID=2736757 RepID=UPI0028114ED1|nr:YegS/Rv2252/BmrU family lipid kinase [Nocardioides campestrisoli]
MLDRSRRNLLAWAAVCLALLALLGTLVTWNRAPLAGFDTWTRDASSWAVGIDWLRSVMLLVEDAFNSVGMTVLTVVVAVALLVKRHPRAATLVAGVMLATGLATTGLKMLLSRERPDWQEAVGLHDTLSFPSGHASSVAAFTLLLWVLASIFVRRASMRRLATAGLGALWFLVLLDRILLGRHFPSDVIGGTLLGAAMVLLGLALLDPRPRSISETTEPLPEVYTSQRRLAVVLNPIKVEDVGQFRHLVTTMAQESGWQEPAWHYTTVEDPGTGMALKAAEAGVDLVLVCGGDGTVREVCAALAGTGIPVGIIPAGTGNLLARNLDIPLYIRSAIDVGLNGQDRAIDMVAVSGDGIDDAHFMVMAGMGFDAAIMEGVNEDIKKRIGWVAYVISGLKSLMFPAYKIEISVDGAEYTTHRARTVVVGNVGYLQAGMPLLPDAAIDDGLIDVVILHPKRFLSWVPLAWRVMAKSARVDETIDRLTGAKVTLRATTDTPRQLDGDSIGLGKELTMECIPGRLLVRVPR